METVRYRVIQKLKYEVCILLSNQGWNTDDIALVLSVTEKKVQRWLTKRREEILQEAKQKGA